MKHGGSLAGAAVAVAFQVAEVAVQDGSVWSVAASLAALSLVGAGMAGAAMEGVEYRVRVNGIAVAAFTLLSLYAAAELGAVRCLVIVACLIRPLSLRALHRDKIYVLVLASTIFIDVLSVKWTSGRMMGYAALCAACALSGWQASPLELLVSGAACSLLLLFVSRMNPIMYLLGGTCGAGFLALKQRSPWMWPTSVLTSCAAAWLFSQTHLGLLEIPVTALITLELAKMRDDRDGREWVPNTRFGILNTILMERDSRRIFGFLLLNFGFMIVQSMYGIWTNSLGLLSDSIHMFFDCLALAVGLVAAVMAKWPRSDAFPNGLGKMEALSGFANGVFLVLISVSIVFEAVTRLLRPPEIMNTDQLLLVSTMGLVVNLVGIISFDHGHQHGHSHGPTHHNHKLDHNHSNDTHNHRHISPHSHAEANGSSNISYMNGHDLTHNHDHNSNHNHIDEERKHAVMGMNEHHDANMHGIFLHIMADLLGSIGVIVSTLLIQKFGWTGFDPLASLLTAAMIFVSSLPLIKISAQSLLLTIPDENEAMLRQALECIGAIRGVVGYSVPRFWIDKDGCKGVVHVQTAPNHDLAQIHERVQSDLSHVPGFAAPILIQVERAGTCWCGK